MYDMSAVKNYISAVKNYISAVKNDISDVKNDISAVKNDEVHNYCEKCFFYNFVGKWRSFSGKIVKQTYFTQ